MELIRVGVFEFKFKLSDAIITMESKFQNLESDQEITERFHRELPVDHMIEYCRLIKVYNIYAE